MANGMDSIPAESAVSQREMKMSVHCLSSVCVGMSSFFQIKSKGMKWFLKRQEIS